MFHKFTTSSGTKFCPWLHIVKHLLSLSNKSSTSNNSFEINSKPSFNEHSCMISLRKRTWICAKLKALTALHLCSNPWKNFAYLLQKDPNRDRRESFIFFLILEGSSSGYYCAQYTRACAWLLAPYSKNLTALVWRGKSFIDESVALKALKKHW